MWQNIKSGTKLFAKTMYKIQMGANFIGYWYPANRASIFSPSSLFDVVFSLSVSIENTDLHERLMEI